MLPPFEQITPYFSYTLPQKYFDSCVSIFIKILLIAILYYWISAY